MTLIAAVNYEQDFSVRYWISKGANPSKIILAMPLYGRGFTLYNAALHGFRAPAVAPIDPGPYTQLNGTWSYIEVAP